MNIGIGAAPWSFLGGYQKIKESGGSQLSIWYLKIWNIESNCITPFKSDKKYPQASISWLSILWCIKRFRVISPLQTPDASNEAVEVGEGGRTDNGGGSVVYSFPAASTPALSDAAPNNASVAGTQRMVKVGSRASRHEPTDSLSGRCTGSGQGGSRAGKMNLQRLLIAGAHGVGKEGPGLVKWTYRDS